MTSPIICDARKRRHVGKGERKYGEREAATKRFFHSFLFVAVPQDSLRYAIGAEYEQKSEE